MTSQNDLFKNYSKDYFDTNTFHLIKYAHKLINSVKMVILTMIQPIQI